MRDRFLTRVAVLVVVAAAVFVTPVDIAGQTAPAKKPVTAAGGVPRLADGHPDLQGTYDLGTLTPLERRAGAPLVLTDEEAKKLEQQVAAQQREAERADRRQPRRAAVGRRRIAGAVRQRRRLQQFLARSRIALHDGRRAQARVADCRSAGRPRPGAHRQGAGRATRRARLRTTSDQAIREDDPGFEGADAYDDPEQRPLGERCIIGFSSTSGPPILPTYFYNNLHQIVQTPDTIVILTEMVHDARIVRMGAQHLPSTIRKWMGDSVGRWEGDTLVIDTTNFTDKTRFRGSSDALHIVERLTRVDAKTLRYQFTVEDPTTWTQTVDRRIHLAGHQRPDVRVRLP